MGRPRRLLAALAALVLVSGRALAHGGVSAAARATVEIPLWLFLATGGGVVGASFLLASFATDRAFIARLHEAREVLDVPARDLLVAGTRVAGVLGLLFVLVVGAVGPTSPDRNAAVLVVWVAWWAGFTMATYLVGNAWPLVNPWRALADVLPTLDRDYRWGAWPAVVGLLALVWVEVVSPVASDPRLLVGVVAGYSVLTLAGAVTYGDAWFREADPVSRVFRAYGRVAPLSRSGSGLGVRLPGSGLDADVLAGDDDVAFVVALLWVTSFDGLVSTRPWRGFAETAVGVGAPAVLLYPAVLVGGYLGFLGGFWLAARYGRRLADSRLPVSVLARRFAPSLLAIAAGYHLAHYLGYLLVSLPALGNALAAPLGPGFPVPWTLPGWFGAVGVVAVLAGHLLAVWVAHAVAYDLFPSRLQAVRSQYALTVVMVAYTMSSLWIVTRPYAPTPFV